MKIRVYILADQLSQNIEGNEWTNMRWLKDWSQNWQNICRKDKIKRKRLAKAYLKKRNMQWTK